MKRLLLALFAVLAFAGTAGAQGYYYSQPVINSRGLPAPGASAAVCTTIATTAASVTSNLATLTMASNPLTAGFIPGATIVISNFTAADTYFNGTFTIAAVSATTIQYSLVHTNASASTPGNAVQKGTSFTPCAPLATVYTDQTLTATSPNPFFADGLGNFNFWAAPAQYWGFIYGPTVDPTLAPLSVPCMPGSTCGSQQAGCIAAGGDTAVQTNHPDGTCYGSQDFTWNDTTKNFSLSDNASNAFTGGTQRNFVIGTQNAISAGVGAVGTTNSIIAGTGNDVTQTNGQLADIFGDENAITSCQLCAIYGATNTISGDGQNITNGDFLYGQSNTLTAVGPSGAATARHLGAIGYLNTINQRTTTAVGDGSFLAGFTNHIDTSNGSTLAVIFGFDNTADGTGPGDVGIWGTSNTATNLLGPGIAASADSAIYGTQNTMNNVGLGLIVGTLESLTNCSRCGLIGFNGALSTNDELDIGVSANAEIHIKSASVTLPSLSGSGARCVHVNAAGTMTPTVGDCATGGSGSVTSVGLVGTANQITITGASPITTSGSWTLSFPTNMTLPGNTTATIIGNASTASAWATPRNLAGNSVDGSANVAFANKLIVQGTVDAGLSGAQFLGALSTGIVKNTATTGVLSIAASADVISLWTGTCNSTTWLRADGACTTPPGGGGTVTSISTTSPLAGGTISTTGTITCLTCVVAPVSPAAGVGHFAGGTQTITSSAVTSADATGNTSGSGNFVLVTSATLITPALGTPSAAVLTNATGLPLSTGVTGTLLLANTPLTTTQDILYDNAGTLARLAIVTSGNCLGNTAGAWASKSCGITLQTNATPNGSQTLLNLAAGSNITLLDNGSGTVTITATGGGGATTPGGSSGQIQYNNSATFGGFTMAGDCTISVPTITCAQASKWTTARNLAGNSVDGSATVAFANKFIVQGTTDAGLSAAQFLGALGTGILKNTTTTGVLSIAVAGDFPTLNQNTTGTAATITGALALANTPLTTDQDVLIDNAGNTGRLGIVPAGTCLGNTAGAWASRACSGLSGLTTFGVMYGTSTTSASTIAAPTANGTYWCGYLVTSSAAVAPSCTLSGMASRSLNGAATTGTVAYSDNEQTIVHDQAASASITLTLPTPTTLGNSNFVFRYVNSSPKIDTISPTTLTIQTGTLATAASLSVPSGATCEIYVDPFSSSRWHADCVNLAPQVNVTVGTLDATGVSTANSGVAQNIVASAPYTGRYAINFYIGRNANCSTGGALTATIGWTDANTGAQSIADVTDMPSNPWGINQAAIWTTSGSAITVKYTYTACSTGGPWTYDAHAWVVTQ